ncbi:GYF domain protein [Theileria parva strain Muguga]|uniref:GYF domain-containing protein n=1 Tax=Theileria parva TaxID=5875 RepID=Q4N5V5_THEPA|nr:GYF domain protein [Theileria parva strain Muguga]EAN32468.1 GYF domain protein [Theileria parva strain Muguga]|eukprot:XP_764751.1 hypothetical protein [Theileria parva strain Muguga]
MFNPRPSSGISHSFSKSSSKLENTNKLDPHPQSALESHITDAPFHASKFKSNPKDHNFRDFTVNRDVNNYRDYPVNYRENSAMEKSTEIASGMDTGVVNNSMMDMSMEMLFGSNKNVLELSSDGVFEKNYLLRLMFTFDRMPRLGNRRTGSETLRFHSVDISVGREQQENFYDKSDKMKKLLYKPLSKRFLTTNPLDARLDSGLLDTKFADSKFPDSRLVDTKFLDSKYLNSRLMDNTRMIDDKLMKGVRNLGIKPMLRGEDNMEPDKEFQGFNAHTNTNGSSVMDMVRHFSRESQSNEFGHFSKMNSHGFNSDHKLTRTFFKRESNDQSFTRQFSNRDSNDQSFTRQFSNRDSNDQSFTRQFSNRESNDQSFSRHFTNRDSNDVQLTRQYSNRENNTDVKLSNLTSSLVQGLNTNSLPRSSSLNAFNLNTEFSKSGFDTKSGFDKPELTKSGFDKSGFENKPVFDAKSGFDTKSGFDKSEFTKSGFDKTGFDAKSGFDKTGFDKNEFTKSGFDKTGFDKSEFTKSGFDTKTGFDKSGFDKNEFTKSGFDTKTGFDKSGFEVDYMLRDKKNEGSKSFLEKLLDKPFETHQSHANTSPNTTTTTTTATKDIDVDLEKDKLSPESSKPLSNTNPLTSANTLTSTKPLSMDRLTSEILSSDRLSSERLSSNRLPSERLGMERVGKEGAFEDMKYWNGVNLQWQYMDPQGMVHGPFSSDQMYHWYVKNFFHQNLRMRFNSKMPWMPFKELFSPNSIPFKSLPKFFLHSPNLPPVTLPNSNLLTSFTGTNTNSGLMASNGVGGLLGSNAAFNTGLASGGVSGLANPGVTGLGNSGVSGLMGNNTSLLSSNSGLTSNSVGGLGSSGVSGLMSNASSSMSKSMDNVWNSSQSTVYPITSMGNIHLSTPKLSVNHLKSPTTTHAHKDFTATKDFTTKDLTSTAQLTTMDKSKELSKELMSDKDLSAKDLNATQLTSSTKDLTSSNELSSSREMSKVEKRWNTTTVEVSSLMEIMELEKKSAKERSVKSPPRQPQTGWNMSDVAPNNFSESDDFPSLATTADTSSSKTAKENVGKKFGKQITMPLETFIEKHPIQPPHLTESFSSKLLGNKH